MNQSIETASSRIPMPLKLAYTAFMAVLIPCYWQAYGPANFLALCDVALIVTLIGLWTESRFLISTQAVAIVFPQLLWIVDFTCGLAGLGSPLMLSAYMFDATIPLFIRGLSLFHIWMPVTLLWLIRRLGYDRTALKGQTLLCAVVLLATFLLVSGPDTPAGNVNRIFGWSSEAQTVMPPLMWLAILIVIHPLLIFIPSHLVLKRLPVGQFHAGQSLVPELQMAEAS